MVEAAEVTRPGEKRPEFVGLALHVATETATDDGMTVRVFGAPAAVRPVKADFRPNRLNLLVRDGIVIDAAIG